jgi:predicted  nucleic acid-binding Zn-ribbon protein
MKKSKIPNTPSPRLSPFGHRRFEEMCALAVTGQLGGPQMTELNEHIAECSSCREYLESLAEASIQTMPLLAEKHAPETTVQPPSGMRDRFLARLAAEDLNGRNRASARPRRAQAEFISLPLDPAPSRPRLVAAKSSSGVASAAWRPALAIAACALIALGGYYLGIRRNQRVTKQLPAVAQSNLTKQPVSSSEPERIGQLEQQRTQLQSELAQLKDRLSTAETDRESLRSELAAAQEKLTAATAQPQAALQRASEQNAEAQNQITALQSNVDRLNRQLAQSEIKLDVQKQNEEDLSTKLALAEDNLQKERDLKSATSQMGELVAARNLHIVDVYDADPNGKRQRAFGRVFYIEGQSLVFYAYDLDGPGEFKQNVVFHVWGGKAGVNDVTHSLGILHKEDAHQSRWAMTFDDPKVLTEINSVFVTAESASKHSDQPRGKKVLYAYFGSQPNHP